MGQAGGSCGRWLRAAPLAGAAATQDEGGRVAFLADTRLSRPAALQVAGRAAEKALHKFVKEVAREQHVDPGVAAAVEAGQEHGDDEGRSCREGREERRTSGHSGTIPDLPGCPCNSNLGYHRLDHKTKYQTGTVCPSTALLRAHSPI